MSLGEKIKFIRLTIRMSQKEFASEIGCAQSLISSYEAGSKKPSYDLLVKLDEIAKKFKVKIKLI